MSCLSTIKYIVIIIFLIQFRLAGSSKPKIFEESSEEEEDEETPEERGKIRLVRYKDLGRQCVLF